MPDHASIPEQIRYYQERWDKENRPNGYSLARMAAVFEMVAQTEFSAPVRICDLGCGSGWCSGVLSVLGPVLGVDLAVPAGASERFPDCRFESRNILEWTPPQTEFDFVFSLEVLEHIEYSQQAKYLAKAYAMLRPGGYLVLTTPNKKTMNAIPEGGRSWSDQPVEDWLNAGELKTLLSTSGFQLVDMSSVILDNARRGFYRVVNSPRVASALRPLGLDWLWSAFFRRRFFGIHLIALARKP
jgi:cyclopropane fatty-acyl-phospholipid synthase-like methyltransferase